MATIRIKQGDQYSIPVSLLLNGEPIDINEVAEVEFTFQNGLRKLFPQEVQYNSVDNCLYIPLTQDETFEFPANGSVTLDTRVRLLTLAALSSYKAPKATAALPVTFSRPAYPTMVS